MSDTTPEPPPAEHPPDQIQSGGAGRRGWVRTAGFTAAGLLAGAAVAGTISANAAGQDSSSSGEASNGYAAPSAPGGTAPDAGRDESQPQRPDEQLLTGTTKQKVQAAALAKYPGATVLRVETDSDGVYEAHLVTAGGQRVTVEVGKDFTVTGTEQGPGGFGGRHGGPGAPAPSEGSSGGTTGTSYVT